MTAASYNFNLIINKSRGLNKRFKQYASQFKNLLEINQKINPSLKEFKHDPQFKQLKLFTFYKAITSVYEIPI